MAAFARKTLKNVERFNFDQKTFYSQLGGINPILYDLANKMLEEGFALRYTKKKNGGIQLKIIRLIPRVENPLVEIKASIGSLKFIAPYSKENFESLVEFCTWMEMQYFLTGFKVDLVKDNMLEFRISLFQIVQLYTTLDVIFSLEKI